jgi:hypothetical protein
VASQEQNKQLVGYAYDPLGRTLETTSENKETKAKSTKVFHYAGAGGALTWTSEGCQSIRSLRYVSFIEPVNAELFDAGLKLCRGEGSGYNPENGSEKVGLKGSLFAGESVKCEAETVYYAWAWFWIPGGHGGTKQEWTGTWRCGESKLEEEVTWSETINGIIPPIAVP